MPRSTRSTERRRWPLWLALLPLAAAVLGYWLAWSGWRDAFRADLARALPGVQATIFGFPYRMEATLERPALTLQGGGARLEATAARALVNRGPWRPELSVISLERPALSMAVPRLGGAAATVAGATAQTSLHIEDQMLRRLSLVWPDARATLGLLDAPLTARGLELHLRELSSPAVGPRGGRRAQLVVSAAAVRLGTGAPLRLTGDLAVTGDAPLRSISTWRRGGTVEIGSLTLGDATGEVLRLGGTLIADGAALRLAGTIDTVCPASLRAAFAGGPPVSEQRKRAVVRIAVGGVPGDWRIAPAEPGEARRPVRAKQPACPRLR